jgi:hypothetical protein
LNTTNGKYGNAMTFNGVNTSINLGNTSSLDPQFFTISAWINPASATTGAIKAGSSNGAPSFKFHSTKVLLLDKQNIATLGSSTSMVSLGTWSHVAVTYNSSGDYNFYINGILSGNGNNVQTFTFSNTTIGGALSTSEYFNGSIDEVRTYNYSLSASEIYELYVSNLIKFNQTQWYLTVNQSSSSGNFLSGTYNYFTSVKDSVGNYNATDKRTINMDNNFGRFNFISPTPDNNTFTTNTSILINASISQPYLNELKFNWNGTNYTIYNDNLILMYNFNNNSALGEN